MTEIEWKQRYTELLMNPSSSAISEAELLRKSNIPFQICKYRKFNDRNLKLLENNLFWLSNAKNFEDKNDARWFKYETGFNETDYFNEYYDSILRDVQTCCFGTSQDNEHLWNNYADNGSGFCIVYEYPSNSYMNLASHLFPVLYFKEKPDITSLIKSMSLPDACFDWERHILQFCFMVKNKIYEKEDEWRFLAFNPSYSFMGGIESDAFLPSKIVYGPNSNQDNVFEMKEKAKRIATFNCIEFIDLSV